MQASIISLLRCPDCGCTRLKADAFTGSARGDIKEGVVTCPRCRSWYPIEEYVLEFLPPALAYWEDRKKFFQKYKTHLKGCTVASRKADQSHNLQRTQQEYFDWYADNERQAYTSYAGSPFWQATDAHIFSAWETRIRPGMRILDVGCAQGRSAFRFADHPIDIVGFDIAKAMVLQAAKRYRSGKYRATMSFLVADATEFPFANRTFSGVILYGVLHHLTDPAGACREIARVLRSGGVYFGLENHASPVRIFFDVLQRVFPIWYEKAGVKPLMTMADFRQWFRRTGVRLDMTTCTFLPPHAVNLLPVGIATRLVRATDAWFSGNPLAAPFGGLIVIKGQKG